MGGGGWRKGEVGGGRRRGWRKEEGVEEGRGGWRGGKEVEEGGGGWRGGKEVEEGEGRKRWRKGGREKEVEEGGGGGGDEGRGKEVEGGGVRGEPRECETVKGDICPCLLTHTYLCATSKGEQIHSLILGHGLSNLSSPTDSGADGRRKVVC